MQPRIDVGFPPGECDILSNRIGNYTTSRISDNTLKTDDLQIYISLMIKD